MTDRQDVSREPRPWFGSWPGHIARSLAYPAVPAWWILERNVERFADRDAVLFLHHEDACELDRLTYRDLWERANSLAAGLAELGVRPGDRVGTLLPNSPALITSYYGIWMAGAAVTPVNALAAEKEVSHQLQNAGAKLLIAGETMAETALAAAGNLGLRVVLAPVGEACRPAGRDIIRFEELIASGRKRPAGVAVDPGEDTAVLLYTGGTTGEPKGAVLTHRNIVANTIQFAEWYALEAGRETFVCTIPMSHSGGMSGVMNVPLYGGATLIVLKRFLAETVARVIEQYRATRFFGVPTMFVALLASEAARSRDMTSLKACRTNAAPLPAAVKEQFDALIGREVLVEGYGLTETSPLTHANPIGRAKAGSIGIPLPDTDAKVIDLATGADLPPGREGELLLRGPQVMKGYWRNPRRHRAGPGRRLVPHGRRGPDGRGGIFLHRRPSEGHDQQRRLQGVAPGGGGGPVHPPRRPPGRGVREPGRLLRRGGKGLHRPEGGSGETAHEAGDHRLLPGTDGGLQGAQAGRVLRQPARQRPGQGAAKTPQERLTGRPGPGVSSPAGSEPLHSGGRTSRAGPKFPQGKMY